MNITTQEELQTKLQSTINSHLKSYRISPTSGNPSKFTSNSQTTVFEIPGDNCFVPSRISLNFKRGQIPAPTGADAAQTYNAVVSNYFAMIERLELKSSNGTILVDVNGINIYSRLSMSLLNNFRENTQLNGALYPTKSIVTDFASSNLQGGDLYLDNKKSTSDVNSETLLRASNYDWSVVGSALASKNMSISLQDLLPDSFFGINKEVYTSRNLYLRIQWAPYTSWLYRPVEGLASFKAIPSDLDIDFTNLNLNMYVEANPQIAQIIKERYNTQQVLICPEIQSNNMTISNSAGDRSLIVKVLNSGDARLYKFYAGLVAGNLTNYYNINNTSNYNNEKYTNVELFLNTLQLLNINCEYNQDLEHALQFYKNHSFSDLASFKVVSPFTHVFDCSMVDSKTYDGLTMRGIPFDNPQGEHSLQIKYKLSSPLGNSVVNPSNQSSFTAWIFTILLKPIYIKGGDIQLIPFN